MFFNLLILIIYFVGMVNALLYVLFIIE